MSRKVQFATTGVTWLMFCTLATAAFFFITMDADVTEYHWVTRVAMLLVYSGLLPAAAVASKELTREPNPPEWQAGVEAMRQAVLAGRFDCEVSRGREKVQALELEYRP